VIEACRAEIEGLHAFFTGWFEGTLPDDDEAFARVAGALGDDFELISPDGRRRDREAILASIRAGHGDHDEFAIEIRHVRLRWSSGGLALVTYEEWQTADGAPPGGRISSAWFREAARAPEGVRWVHLHETALPRPADG